MRSQGDLSHLRCFRLRGSHPALAFHMGSVGCSKMVPKGCHCGANKRGSVFSQEWQLSSIRTIILWGGWSPIWWLNIEICGEGPFSIHVPLMSSIKKHGSWWIMELECFACTVLVFISICPCLPGQPSGPAIIQGISEWANALVRIINATFQASHSWVYWITGLQTLSSVSSIAQTSPTWASADAAHCNTTTILPTQKSAFECQPKCSVGSMSGTPNSSLLAA